MKRSKIRVVKAPTAKQMALGPKEKEAMRQLFEWEKASAKSKTVIGQSQASPTVEGE